MWLDCLLFYKVIDHYVFCLSIVSVLLLFTSLSWTPILITLEHFPMFHISFVLYAVLSILLLFFLFTDLYSSY